MAASNSTRSVSTFPVAGAGWAGNRKTAWGSAVPAGTVLSGVYELCRIPKGAIVIGGNLRATGLETLSTAGSSTVAVQVGSLVTAAKYGLFTTLGLALTNGEAGFNLPLGGLLVVGPVTTEAEEVIAVTLTTGVGVTAALTAGSGIWITVDYLLP